MIRVGNVAREPSIFAVPAGRTNARIQQQKQQREKAGDDEILKRVRAVCLLRLSRFDAESNRCPRCDGVAQDRCAAARCRLAIAPIDAAGRSPYVHGSQNARDLLGERSMFGRARRRKIPSNGGHVRAMKTPLRFAIYGGLSSKICEALRMLSARQVNGLSRILYPDASRRDGDHHLVHCAGGSSDLTGGRTSS